MNTNSSTNSPSVNPPVARNQEKNDAMSAAAALALTGLQSVPTSSADDNDNHGQQTGKGSETSGKMEETNSLEVTKSFPQLLMDILTDPANEDCVSWLPHGCSFRVHNRSRFLDEILPPYYKNKKIKYTSFTRKLSRWDFVRLSSGPDTGAFYHKLFQRDNPKLVRRMFCKGERSQFPRNLSALAGLPPHVQAAVAAGLPGTFGGMGWNTALGVAGGVGGVPQAQMQVGAAQSQQQAMMQQHQMDPQAQMQLQLQLQLQHHQQNFVMNQDQALEHQAQSVQAVQAGGAMMSNTSFHSADGSTASAPDQQDSTSSANEQAAPAPAITTSNTNPAGMSIGPTDMTAFLASMRNPNISPAVKAQMLAQQQTLLQQQQLILQQQLAASGINVAVTRNPPVTDPTPTATAQHVPAQQEAAQPQPQQAPEQPQPQPEQERATEQATVEPESLPQQQQQQQQQPPHEQQHSPEPKAQESQPPIQHQKVSPEDLHLEIHRQMDLLRAQQAAALQGRQQPHSAQQHMSAHDFLAAQVATKLDTSNLHFTPMQQGAGQDDSPASGSGRSPSTESGGAVKRAWAA